MINRDLNFRRSREKNNFSGLPYYLDSHFSSRRNRRILSSRPLVRLPSPLPTFPTPSRRRLLLLALRASTPPLQAPPGRSYERSRLHSQARVPAPSSGLHLRPRAQTACALPRISLGRRTALVPSSPRCSVLVSSLLPSPQGTSERGKPNTCSKQNVQYHFVILMRTNNSTSDEIQTSEPRSHAWFQQTASR